jgi:hypothetical protein
MPERIYGKVIWTGDEITAKNRIAEERKDSGYLEDSDSGTLIAYRLPLYVIGVVAEAISGLAKIVTKPFSKK